MSNTVKGSINYRDEVVRKLIHLCSLSIPILYSILPKSLSITLLAGLVAFAVVVDVSRYFFEPVAKIVYKVFGFLLREHEIDSRKKNLNGATYVLISALFCAVIFPIKIFITAFTVLIISDSMAALIGRKFGKTKFLAKSLQGTLAFFISAMIVVLLTPKYQNNIVEYYIGFIAVFVGAIVENVSFGWADDNFSIPISVGFIMWLLYYFLLPGISL